MTRRSYLTWKSTASSPSDNYVIAGVFCNKSPYCSLMEFFTPFNSVMSPSEQLGFENRPEKSWAVFISFSICHKI